MKNKFYITTPIYYVNAKPHIGHAYTTIAADVLARFHKNQGDDVFFLTGTDEHGLKIQRKAEESGKESQRFVDEISQEFVKLWKDLNVEYSGFIRTSSENHKKAIQKALATLKENGAIYKGIYKGLYCVGCEQFKNESDLVDGKCPDHNIVPELLEEESWMMKMTSIQKDLIEKIKSDEFKVEPEKYKKEILGFLELQALKDVSISRKNVTWGIPLPFDAEHTTYVWVDALLNYLTGIGWEGDPKNIPGKWPVDLQLIGKDILRVHATIWPAILMHLGIEFPKTLFTHGHILSAGKKMSKTLGNAISVDEMLEKFGTDGTRYLLLSAGTFGEDVDMTMDRMTEKYNADLANGLGNLVSRTVKLISSSQIIIPDKNQKTDERISDLLGGLKISEALNDIWKMVGKCNKFIEDNKPWDLAKNNQERFDEVMRNIVSELNSVSEFLSPFLPATSEKIKKALDEKSVEPLFRRIK